MSSQQRPTEKDWDALSRRVEALEAALRDRPQPQPDHIPDARKMVDTGWRNLHDLSPIYEPAPPEPEQPMAGLVNPEWNPDAIEQARTLRYMAERETSRGPAPPEPEQPRAGLLDGLVNPDCNPDAIEQVLARVLCHIAKQEASRGPAPPEPAPAVELVERVKLIIAKTVAGEKLAVVEPDCWDGEARAAIREIAAATDQMAPDRNLTWERVALWLEREASR